MPLVFLVLFLPFHLFITLLTLVVFAIRKKGRVVTKAKWHALRDLGPIWQSRKEVQAKRSISLGELWRSFDKRWNR